MKRISFNSIFRIHLWGCTFFVATVAHSADFFVKSGASGRGSSWDDATSLENALWRSAHGDRVYVAGGEYSCSKQMTLSKVISIQGGYVGNETKLDKPDWIKNPVVLNGQKGIRALVVHLREASNSPLLIDGIKFVGFEPNEKNNGGAVAINATTVNVTFRNLIFESCKVVAQNSDDPSRGSNGGAVYINNFPEKATIVFENCLFAGCKGREGGAIYGNSVSQENGKKLIVKDCQFVDNVAQVNGGALYFRMGYTVEINKSTFADNSSGIEDKTGSGGAIYLHFANHLEIDQSTFRANKATQKGSVVYGNGNADNPNRIQFNDCVLIQNFASRSDNGRFAIDSDNIAQNLFTLENSVVANNTNAKNSCADMSLAGASTDNLVLNSIVNGVYVTKKTADELSAKGKYQPYLSVDQERELSQQIGVKDASRYRK